MNMNLSKIIDIMRGINLSKVWEKIESWGVNDADKAGNEVNNLVTILGNYVQAFKKPNPDVASPSGGSTQPSNDITLDNLESKLNGSINNNIEKIPSNSREIITDITTTLINEADILKNLVRTKTDILSCIEFDTRANVDIGKASTLCKEGVNLANSIKNFKI